MPTQISMFTFLSSTPERATAMETLRTGCSGTNMFPPSSKKRCVRIAVGEHFPTPPRAPQMKARLAPQPDIPYTAPFCRSIISFQLMLWLGNSPRWKPYQIQVGEGVPAYF